MRSLFAYLNRQGVTGIDPAAVVTTPKLPARLPRIVAGRPLDGVCWTRPIPRRRPGCATGHSSSCSTRPGARVSEVAGLDVADVDLRGAQVRVMGKGSKQRVLPLHPLAVSRLEAYLRSGRPALAPAPGRDGVLPQPEWAPD